MMEDIVPHVNNSTDTMMKTLLIQMNKVLTKDEMPMQITLPNVMGCRTRPRDYTIRGAHAAQGAGDSLSGALHHHTIINPTFTDISPTNKSYRKL